ncbi:hypothetical protein HPP92_023608 [Vanilla planifolia]|uniref:Uncharacterized protein n=1 Tax=Vanilla planifolia TaxID=51239 RepID=A0A835PNS6_VANPL|nr:hypothetical protein HPP92_023917 [Vanilla planifolia]KAG0455820.1 hypothetical protein HPP92_023608 [Vanilla planifolia]
MAISNELIYSRFKTGVVEIYKDKLLRVGNSSDRSKLQGNVYVVGDEVLVVGTSTGRLQWRGG